MVMFGDIPSIAVSWLVFSFCCNTNQLLRKGEKLVALKDHNVNEWPGETYGMEGEGLEGTKASTARIEGGSRTPRSYTIGCVDRRIWEFNRFCFTPTFHVTSNSMEAWCSQWTCMGAPTASAPP